MTLGGTFPLWALILMLAFISAVLAYYFSAEDEPPRWHPVSVTVLVLMPGPL